MFDYIRGKVTFLTSSTVTLETAGVGYRILIPPNHQRYFPAIGEESLVFVSLIQRETGPSLFGFLKAAERELFEIYISLSGIGPKSALGLIGHLTFSELKRAVDEKRCTSLTKVPGIGKKTAEKLLVDLQDKLKLLPFTTELEAEPEGPTILLRDAIQALTHLGYSIFAAEKAVKNAFETLSLASAPIETSALISAALRSEGAKGRKGEVNSF